MNAATENIFFELLRVSFGSQESLSATPSASMWRSLYAMAKKQSVLGICFVGISQISNPDGGNYAGMPEALYYEWAGVALQIHQRNEVINRQCVELQSLFSESGFRSFIMKGQGNATLYGDLALYRQPGDIDAYLEGGFKRVNDYVQRTCPSREVNELEIHYHCYIDTEVEIHYRPVIMRNPFKNRRLQVFLGALAEDCYTNRISLAEVGEISVPINEFNLVQQMVHIFHHLLTGGIGLRQVMDYYFVLRSQHGAPNMRVCEIVSCLGLNRFASALMWVLGYLFGLAEDLMLWRPEKKDGMFLLDEVMCAGNFGKSDKRIIQNRTKWQSFWVLSVRNFRLIRFARDDCFWGPIWRLYHFAWKKLKGFE